MALDGPSPARSRRPRPLRGAVCIRCRPDHRRPAQGLGIGRGGIGLQIDLGDIESVQPALEDLVERIRIPRCEAVGLAVIQHPCDLRPEGLPIDVGLEGSGQLPGPFMLKRRVRGRRLVERHIRNQKELVMRA